MQLRRHYVDVPEGAGQRRVHLRVMGAGPPLLLVHQSPRSSAEWLPLMARHADRFTLIAPDTPGFGQSAPLADPGPDVDSYAQALLALLDRLGLPPLPAYGFHSGAIILMRALMQAPTRFTALACGGLALWTKAERADFGARYTPPFHPCAYGEHLAWAWSRVLEQSWVFPWYRLEPAARLPAPHADAARVHDMVMEMLEAGNAYALGYAAVLQAPRDLPPADAMLPPVLIAAYAGDPLQAHLDRLPALPAGWAARKVDSPAALEAAALDFLARHPAAAPLPALQQVANAGFLPLRAPGFDGLIHWQGSGTHLFLHAPGDALGDAPAGSLALDLPGHGLSDDWRDPPRGLDGWVDLLAAAVAAAGWTIGAVAGAGWSDLLANRLAGRLQVAHHPSARPRGDRARWRAEGLPDIRPDRFGSHLLRAWQALRAEVLFDPWFEVSAASGRDFAPEELACQRLARRHLARLRARSGQALLEACLDAAPGDDKDR